MFTTLTFNLGGSPVRHERLHDRDYLVAPLAMLTEGVHKGSGGALLYKADECKRAIPAWNMKPIVVYHPEINGRGVSACDPDILERQQIGMLMNTRWDNKLRSEAWIDEARARTVDDRVLRALEENKMMEVSTGLFTDNVGEPGEWSGEAYVAVATNHQPDHLALLPDKVGACSIADGAGLLQLNSAISHANINSALQRALSSHIKTSGTFIPWIQDVYSDFFIYDPGDSKLYKQVHTITNGAEVELIGEPEEVVRVTEYRTVAGKFVGNAAATKIEGGVEYPAAAYAYVPDPETPSTWKLRLWETPEKKETAAQVGRAVAAIGKGFRGQKAQIPSDMMKSVKEKIRAAWKRTNPDKEEGEMPSVLRNERKTKTMDKKMLVTALIANEQTRWSEEDRDGLMTLEEDALEKMLPVEEPEAKEEVKEVKEVEQKDGDSEVGRPLTMEQYVAAAPPEYRDVLENGLAVYREQKDALIAAVVENKANQFSKEFLQTKGLKELQALAALATADAPQQSRGNIIPMFLGAAIPPGPTGNEASEEPLVMQTMKFGTEQ